MASPSEFVKRNIIFIAQLFVYEYKKEIKEFLLIVIHHLVINFKHQVKKGKPFCLGIAPKPIASLRNRALRGLNKILLQRRDAGYPAAMKKAV